MESEIHISLCRILKSDMEKCIPESLLVLWETGTIAFREFPTTTEISGFRPDLKVYSDSKAFCALGDAKTANDIKNKHTKAQLFAFLGFGQKYKLFALFYRVPANCYHHFAHFIKSSSLPDSFRGKLFINNIPFIFDL